MAEVTRTLRHRGQRPESVRDEYYSFKDEARELFHGEVTPSCKFVAAGDCIEVTFTRVEPTMASIKEMLGASAPAKGQPMKKSVLGLNRLKGVMDELRNPSMNVVHSAAVNTARYGNG